MMPPVSGDTDDAQEIGILHGVGIGVAPRDAVTANVALTIAGMFMHEVGAGGPDGGLRHLDEALGGAIVRLRADGIFGAGLGELLALAAPAPPIRASTVLVVGLGNPPDWSMAALRTAIAAAACEALRLQATSAAFAPSLIDSGIEPGDPDAIAEALIAGLTDVLSATTANPRNLSRWVFCSGSVSLNASAESFRRAFERITRR